MFKLGDYWKADVEKFTEVKFKANSRVNSRVNIGLTEIEKKT